MVFILQLIIFLIIVFIYLHVKFQLKINNNLEVYEIDYDTNENLQKVCDLKLPVVFNAKNIGFVEFPSELTEEQQKMEINVKDNTDNSNVKMSYNAANTLISSNEKYYSKENNDYLRDSELIIEYKKNDDILCPALIVEREYDIIIGSKKCYIKVEKHIGNRKYMYVKKGKIKVIIGEKKDDVEKENEKTISVNVMEGNVINIPPHLYYKVIFEERSEIMSYTYKGVINKIIEWISASIVLTVTFCNGAHIGFL